MLLLNGIGPAAELEKLNITVVKDLPGVGKHFRDHVMTFLCAEVDGKHNDRYSFETSESRMGKAVADWEKDKTGDLALYNSGLWGGFLKLPGLEELPEYKALDPAIQKFISQEKTPTYELIGNCIQFPPGTPLAEGSSYLTSVAFLMNAQSEGSVTLRSADPEDKPEIELNFLKHPYDRRVFREAIRQTWTKFYENPEIKPLVKNQLYGPKTLSDEDVDAFMKEATTTVWHANGTAAMGKPDDLQACVDTSFRVYGVQGLRVADLSVCPLTTK
jgi:choline dehydrogenase-like flavoprotein